MTVGISGVTPFGRHAGPVFCVTFSPSGGFFATGGQDHTVRLWDAHTGEQAGQFDGYPGDVYAVAFSPDGETLAISCGAGFVRLWNTATGQLRQQLTRHDGFVRDVAFSPDGATLATACVDGFARLWDLSTGHRSLGFPEQDGQLLAATYSPDGATLATVGRNGVRLWDTAAARQDQLFAGPDGFVSDVIYGPDGAALAIVCRDGIRLWDITTRRQIRQFSDHGTSVLAGAYSPDGTALATGGENGIICLWDAATGRQIHQLTGHDAPVSGVVFSPDGSTLVTAGVDGGIYLWDATTGQQARKCSGHVGSVHAVAYSPDGTSLATAGDNGSACLWDAATGQRIRQLTGHVGWVNAVAFSPDGTTLGTASDDGTARLWEAATGQQIRQLTGHGDCVWHIVYRPDGATLATVTSDVVRLWDTATGQELRQLQGYQGNVAYSPDGATLATIDTDAVVRLWDTATGQELRQLQGYQGNVAYSPDGATVATTGDNGYVRLWDTATGQQIRQFAGHDGTVWGAAFSPDGTTLATVGRDDGIRLWDTATGQQRHHLTGHDGIVYEAAFSPDGTTLASVGRDGTIRIWNTRNGAQVNGTGFGEARTPARVLAGVRSDSPSDRDLLGVADDVETLAELIAAAETTPPLAIALIGDWGVGKSSVMLQMETHIGVLADRARNNPGLTAWAENVRQVRFNAWHYSDDHLWAGLVSHLFGALAGPVDRPGGADAEQAEQSVAEVSRRLQEELTAKQKASARLAGELRAADTVQRPGGRVAWLGSPWFAARVLAAAVRQGFQDLRTAAAAVAGWILLGAGAFFAWVLLGHWIAALVTAVAVVAPPLLPTFRRLRAGHDAVLGFADRQRAGLAARQQECQRQISEIQDQLVLVDAAARLRRFLSDRANGGAYRPYQGLLGQVRADLDQLSADLAAARGQWERSGRAGSPPLERIVLYIDDLDRCPPRRVVEVLEAVHLMLALDLFVVVVAVDARWLIRSLEYHHQELFRMSSGHAEAHDKRRDTSRHPANGGSGDGYDENKHDGDELATPVDYLDKIFQIPFVLPPPKPEATGAYLRSLLPEPARRPPTATIRQNADAGARVPTVSELADATTETSLTRADVAEADGITDQDGAADLPKRDRFGWREHDLPDHGQRSTELHRGPGTDGRSLGPVAVELRPQRLQISQAEAEFMARLGGLLPTPRAAKRLVNIYRLVRIGIPATELAEFVGDQGGGPYQAVQVLLAMLAGHPLFAREVFRKVISGTHAEDLATVAEEVREPGADTGAFRIINAFLIQVRSEAPMAVSISLCRRWCPRLARFSFYTRGLADSWPGDTDEAAIAARAGVDAGRERPSRSAGL